MIPIINELELIYNDIYSDYDDLINDNEFKRIFLKNNLFYKMPPSNNGNYFEIHHLVNGNSKTERIKYKHSFIYKNVRISYIQGIRINNKIYIIYQVDEL